MKALLLAVLCTINVGGSARQQEKGAFEDKHHQGVVERGDQVMGFSHDETSHHFLLFANGGAITAAATHSKDLATREAIREHFRHIAKMFSEGDFSAPMLIHEENPPGTETMKRLRDQIQYKVENKEGGATIRITTRNEEALEAIHQFLRFQIRDHRTGDSGVVTKSR